MKKNENRLPLLKTAVNLGCPLIWLAVTDDSR